MLCNFPFAALASFLGFVSAALLGCSAFDVHAASTPPLRDAAADRDDARARGGCVHATFPARPGVTEDDASYSFVVAVDHENLADSTNEAGMPSYQTTGYDLDGKCTGEGDGPSCAEPPWAFADHTDGPGGLDNALGAIAYAVNRSSHTSATKAAQGSIAVGALTIVLEVNGYNGTVNDDRVTVAAFGGTLDPRATGAVFEPKWDGNDRWYAEPAWFEPSDGGDAQTFVVVEEGGVETHAAERPRYVDDGAYVTGGVLVAQIPRLILANRFPASGVVITADVVRSMDGVGWSLHDGIIAGKIGLDDALAAAGLSGGSAGDCLCTGSAAYLGYKEGICSTADIRSEDSSDPSEPCDAMSFGATFTASPAKLVGVALPSHGSCCPPETSPANDHCDTLATASEAGVVR